MAKYLFVSFVSFVSFYANATYLLSNVISTSGTQVVFDMGPGKLDQLPEGNVKIGIGFCSAVLTPVLTRCDQTADYSVNTSHMLFMPNIAKDLNDANFWLQTATFRDSWVMSDWIVPQPCILSVNVDSNIVRVLYCTWLNSDVFPVPVKCSIDNDIVINHKDNNANQVDGDSSSAGLNVTCSNAVGTEKGSYSLTFLGTAEDGDLFLRQGLRTRIALNGESIIVNETTFVFDATSKRHEVSSTLIKSGDIIPGVYAAPLTVVMNLN